MEGVLILFFVWVVVGNMARNCSTPAYREDRRRAQRDKLRERRRWLYKHFGI